MWSWVYGSCNNEGEEREEGGSGEDLAECDHGGIVFRQGAIETTDKMSDTVVFLFVVVVICFTNGGKVCRGLELRG